MKKKPNMKYMTVTPDRAMKWLEHPKNENRTLSNMAIMRLAKQMQQEEYRVK